jgi:hypothetical protein
MDEVFGYLPPVANPPSKLPLLTLLKQARASGVGIMLATQNPVDLDYKALSNTGTWFLGKLQTERDKARVLDGLEGLSSTLTRDQLDQALSALRSRVFLMHNVHEHEPVLFETRWTLSYLRGPLTREELRTAMGSQAAGAGESGRTSQGPSHEATPAGSSKPMLPAGIDEYFMPDAAGAAVYRPVVYGSARVQYADARRGIDVSASVHATVPINDGAVPVNWDEAEDTTVGPDGLAKSAPAVSASFHQLPPAARSPRSYAEWSADFEQWIARARPLRLFAAAAYKMSSRPGETEGEFTARVQQAARERRDDAVEKLRARYAPRVTRTTDKIRRAGESLAREEQQASQQKLQTAVSFGATLLGALMGRKAVSASTLGRATTAARGVSRSMKEGQDVEQARERQREAEEELKQIEAELQREVDALQDSSADPTIESTEIKAKKANIDVQLVALAWKAAGD